MNYINTGLAILKEDFRAILKRNGFIDKDSTVTRRVDNHGTEPSVTFEVITRRSMNIGNLNEIEKRWGLMLYYVAPHENGMRVVFGPVYPRR
jgi:hypothetical protein